MAFIAKDSGGGDFKRVPPGAYIGRCYSLIDLGTQLSSGQYGEKMQHKIRIAWELFGEDEQGIVGIGMLGSELTQCLDTRWAERLAGCGVEDIVVAIGG